MPRPRWRSALLVGLLIGLGLASRSSLAAALPVFLQTYAGDTLWAMLVFFGFALLCPAARSWQLAAAALAFSFAIEFSQLWQAPWLEALRSNRVAALVLGRGFLLSDLFCYSAGIALAALADRAMTPGLATAGEPAAGRKPSGNR